MDELFLLHYCTYKDCRNFVGEVGGDTCNQHSCTHVFTCSLGKYLKELMKNE